jgi:hypothetical protein
MRNINKNNDSISDVMYELKMSKFEKKSKIFLIKF